MTGDTLPKTAMIRFVVGPAGEVVPDVENRLPGRGIWLSARRSVVNTACAKRSFARAARAAVTTPDDLADRVEALLIGRCLALVGLARRGGQLVAGYEKVRARLRENWGRLLLAAADGADGSRSKVRALAPDLPVADPLSAEQLGQALGREAAVHVLIGPGGLAARLKTECDRLAGFREPPTDQGEAELVGDPNERLM
ncbi:conserved protein of unknown function [Magnetospira sp. QH-2]|nr:conserved protein of unknown function [Magnetospira sp. QH-2]